MEEMIPRKELSQEKEETRRLLERLHEKLDRQKIYKFWIGVAGLTASLLYVNEKLDENADQEKLENLKNKIEQIDQVVSQIESSPEVEKTADYLEQLQRMTDDFSFEAKN